MPEKTRVIRRRITSVRNTRKITRTMEMVAASKLKRAQARVTGTVPYMEALQRIMARLASGEVDRSAYPLFAEREVKRELLWVLTADRGLCGAFNVNLIRLGQQVLERERKLGRDVKVWVSGRKGISAFRFRGIQADRQITGMTDKPTYDDALEYAEELTAPFLSGEVDRVIIVWPRYVSVGHQPPSELVLCPISSASAPEAGVGKEREEGETKTKNVAFLFEPNADAILGRLLPLYVRNMVYRVLADQVAGEMIARRMAMMLATENAEKLARQLTLQYNKARQAQITQEIAEILGGTEALD